jgi:hypothetical protein
LYFYTNKKHANFWKDMMQDSFTLHCVTWSTRAAMLEAVRADAYRMGLLTQAESQTETADQQCLHALVLSVSGKVIGCARITPYGETERLAILVQENRSEIESALKLAAWLNEDKSLQRA